MDDKLYNAVVIKVSVGVALGLIMVVSVLLYYGRHVRPVTVPIGISPVNDSNYTIRDSALSKKMATSRDTTYHYIGTTPINRYLFVDYTCRELNDPSNINEGNVWFSFKGDFPSKRIIDSMIYDGLEYTAACYQKPLIHSMFEFKSERDFLAFGRDHKNNQMYKKHKECRSPYLQLLPDGSWLGIDTTLTLRFDSILRRHADTTKWKILNPEGQGTIFPGNPLQLDSQRIHSHKPTNNDTLKLGTAIPYGPPPGTTWLHSQPDMPRQQ